MAKILGLRSGKVGLGRTPIRYGIDYRRPSAEVITYHQMNFMVVVLLQLNQIKHLVILPALMLNDYIFDNNNRSDKLNLNRLVLFS